MYRLVIVGNPFTGLSAGTVTMKGEPVSIIPSINPMQVLSVGIQIATSVASAFEEYLNDGKVTVPPIRTYIGKEHVEIQIGLSKLPPP